MGPVSEATWDGWLARVLPPSEAGPAPRWRQAMAQQHAALASAVKALYDVDYYQAGTLDWFARRGSQR